jgi:hypothetical protein
MCRGLPGPAIDEVKCIFHSFLFFLRSRGFTVLYHFIQISFNPSPLVTCDQLSELLVWSVAAEPCDIGNLYGDFHQGTADFAKFCDTFAGWIRHLEGGTRDRRDISLNLESL